MSLSYWKIDQGVIAVDAGSAGAYISRELGLAARKERAKNAIAVMADPAAAVTAYNTSVKALEDEAGAEFVKFQKKAYDRVILKKWQRTTPQKEQPNG